MHIKDIFKKEEKEERKKGKKEKGETKENSGIYKSKRKSGARHLAGRTVSRSKTLQN